MNSLDSVLWRKNPKLNSFYLRNIDEWFLNGVKMPKGFSDLYHLHMFSIFSKKQCLLSFPDRVSSEKNLNKAFKALVRRDEVKPFLIASGFKQWELYRFILTILPLCDDFADLKTPIFRPKI